MLMYLRWMAFFFRGSVYGICCIFWQQWFQFQCILNEEVVVVSPAAAAAVYNFRTLLYIILLI